jgi:hypothetical protein
MRRETGWAFALGVLLLCPRQADAETQANKPSLARELLQGCLKPPSQETVSQLASAVGGTPYSEARRRRELTTNTVTYPEPDTGQDQRTKTTVTEFQGWDLPGPGAGALEYQGERSEIVWLDRASQQSVTPVRVALDRSCRLHAPVANARAIFELLEGMTDRRYGIRIAADRRWIDVFMFDEDHYDVELSLELEAPLAGLASDAAGQESHLILTDGGPRFIDYVAPGIPTVKLTRAALLAGLDQPATMSFFNTEIEPVVQRLATARSASSQGRDFLQPSR